MLLGEKNTNLKFICEIVNFSQKRKLGCMRTANQLNVLPGDVPFKNEPFEYGIII